MRTIDGFVTIVQESRFQLVDDAGVGHMVILAPDTLAEPDQLVALAHNQTRVRIRYTKPSDVIGFLAHSVATL